MSDPNSSLSDSARRIKVVADGLEAIYKGGPTTTVNNGNADLPSIQKLLADADAEINEGAESVLAQSNAARDVATAAAAVVTAGLATASLAAQLAGGAARLFASTADALSNGVSQLSFVAGSGGTDGTYAITLSGGGGSGALGQVQVLGGKIVSTLIQYPGRNYTSAPTASITVPGLSGGSVTASIGVNAPAGTYFSTPSSSSVESVNVYLNLAGVATLQKAYPSAGALQAVSDRIPTEPDGGQLSWYVRDEAGNAAFGVMSDGTVLINALQLSQLTTQILSLGGNGIDSVPGDGDAYCIEDGSGNKALRIKGDGTVAVLALEADTLNGIPVSALISGNAGVAAGGFTAEVNGLASYGQSVSVGTNSTPLLTTVQHYDNLRFSGGVRAWDNSGGSNYGSLVPLVEQISSNLAETPLGGATDIIKELVQAENGLSYTQHTYRLLGSAPGVPGITIAALSKPSTGYTRLTNDISNGLALANAQGLSYRFQAATWTQGEADYTAGTTLSAYEARLDAMQLNIDATAKSVVGQSNTVPLLVGQIASHSMLGSAYPVIALAQLQTAIDRPNVHLSHPMYPLVYNNADVHLSNVGSRLHGAYFGLCYKRIVVDGQPWEPLRPVLSYRQGSVIFLKFHVPKPPLAFDTALVAAAANSGFSVVDASNAAVAISSVSLNGPDVVKIVCAAPPGAGSKVRYAFGTGSETQAGKTAGPRGNLRDSQGNTIVFDPSGLNVPMHNWCVLFEQTLS